MSEKRIECPLCRTGTYQHFGYTGSGVCDHCGAEWTYDETDTLTGNAMRALWEKIPHWIPVTERLPNERQLVIACDTSEMVCSRIFEGGRWIGPATTLPTNGVTHWMPLPAPPTDSK